MYCTSIRYNFNLVLCVITSQAERRKRGKEVKKIVDFFTNAIGVVTTRFVSNLGLPEMITDKSVTTPVALMNCYAIHWIATTGLRPVSQ